MATFYGEGNSNLDKKSLEFLDKIEKSIQLWQNNKDSVVKCSSCNSGNHILQYNYNKSFLFTNCAIIFWNCPPLKKDFIEKLKQKMGKNIYSEKL